MEKTNPTPTLTHLAEAELPTEYGTFRTLVFSVEGEDGEHLALVYGEPKGKENVIVRVHSECLTGEVLGSLKCDCGAQFDSAMREVAKRGTGVILYLRQEGRGIGLANKIRAYALQAEGADTVDANRLLGLPDDARTYGGAAGMLQHLGVRSIELITNNPLKVEALESYGVKVAARVPSLVPVGVHAQRYLDVKRDRMQHMLPEREAVSQSVAHGATGSDKKRT